MSRRPYGLLKHPDQEIRVFEIDLVVKRGVFLPSPEYTHSTTFLVKHLPNANGKRVLDLGCGSGVLGILCAKRGASFVLATDIDPKAVDNARENALRNHCSNLRVKQSDLFSSISDSFDVIFANLPIADSLWGISTLELIETFLKQLPSHLKKNGTAYLTWASFRPVRPIRTLLKQSSFAVTETREKFRSRTWYLFALTLRQNQPPLLD